MVAIVLKVGYTQFFNTVYFISFLDRTYSSFIKLPPFNSVEEDDEQLPMLKEIDGSHQFEKHFPSAATILYI